MKRLAVFLDGTYNEPGDNTNVWRLYSMLAGQDHQGNAQLSYYDAGVGTKWYDKVRGGAVGAGLQKNTRQAYQWLVEHYDDGDEIFVFGFSRGAFTARSLTGMLAKCGLLTPGSPIPVLQVYQRYENAESTPLYRLNSNFVDRNRFSLEDKWMVAYSRQVRVKFIGVWDTVGALNLRLKKSRREQRGEYNSHFVRLSKFFDHAYQALAIDEHRESYPISRWYTFVPERKPDKTHQPPPIVEQRWFAGAHSNVGGGYSRDPLPQIPLQWIQEKAQAADLHFRHLVQLSGDETDWPVTDSYRNFLKGIYRVIKFGRRSYREIGVDRSKVTSGWIDSLNESIDGSVFEKWKADGKYRPKNLKAWAQKHGLDPGELSGDQSAQHSNATHHSANG